MVRNLFSISVLITFISCIVANLDRWDHSKSGELNSNKLNRKVLCTGTQCTFGQRNHGENYYKRVICSNNRCDYKSNIELGKKMIKKDRAKRIYIGPNAHMTGSQNYLYSNGKMTYEYKEKGVPTIFNNRPMPPVENKPVQPVENKPVQPLENKPVQPVENKPVPPLENKLVQPVENKLVQPVENKPILSVVNKPVPPVVNKQTLPYISPHAQMTESKSYLYSNGKMTYEYKEKGFPTIFNNRPIEPVVDKSRPSTFKQNPMSQVNTAYSTMGYYEGIADFKEAMNDLKNIFN